MFDLRDYDYVSAVVNIWQTVSSDNRTDNKNNQQFNDLNKVVEDLWNIYVCAHVPNFSTIECLRHSRFSYFGIEISWIHLISWIR